MVTPGRTAETVSAPTRRVAADRAAVTTRMLSEARSRASVLMMRMIRSDRWSRNRVDVR